MANNPYQYQKDAFASSLGDFIASIGEGVGEAQAALDQGSLRQTLEIYNADPDTADATLKLLREIGYQPTFYTLPKTTAKAKISLSISQTKSNTLSGNQPFRTKMYATPVNASNINKYNMNLNASAELQFDIVPVPPSDSQVIRFVPNVIYKTVDHEDGSTSEVKRTFSEIKTLLNSYGLTYAFAESVEEENLTEASTFEQQNPAFTKDQHTIIRLGDAIILS